MKTAGTIMIILALVIGIVPQFTDCQSQGRAIELANGRTIPMKCHWTAQAGLVVAGPLLLVGLLLAFNKMKENQRILSIIAVVLGVYAILLPTVLIGVCASDEMLCNVAMKPTLIFSGILTVISGAVVFILASRRSPELAHRAGVA